MAADSKQIVSKQWSLQGRDWVKGLVLAVLSSVFAIVQVALDAGSLDFDWKTIGIAAVSAALGYLSKNFFETTKVVEVKQGEAAKEIIEGLKSKEEEELGV